MRKFFLLIFAVGLVLDGCGGGLDMTMKPSKGFKVKSSVEVESNGFDPESLQSKIERALFENGVNIESAPLTQGGIAVLNDSTGRAVSQPGGKTTKPAPADSSKKAKVSKMGSHYLLEFTYDSNYTFSGVMITDFSATVFDAGEIVGMMSFHGGQMTPDKLAENVGKKLSQELK